MAAVAAFSVSHEKDYARRLADPESLYISQVWREF